MRAMRSILALASLAQTVAIHGGAAVGKTEDFLHSPQPQPEPDPMIENRRAAQATRLGDFRRPVERASRLAPEDAARFKAEGDARRARKAAKALAIRDAQLARGQRVA